MTRSPRQRRRNAAHSSRQTKRLEKAYRYWSPTGEGLPGVSEVLSILSVDSELKESLGEVVSMPGYIKPIYFTRAAIGGRVFHTGVETHFTPENKNATGMEVEALAAVALHNANGRGEMIPEEVKKEARKQRWAFDNWSRWALEEDFNVHSVERTVIDDELGLGMTADLVEKDGEALCVTDWKTTAYTSTGRIKDGLLVKYRLQLGAYAGLIGRAEKRRVSKARLVFAPKVEDAPVFTVELNREELAHQWKTFRKVLDIYQALRGEREQP